MTTVTIQLIQLEYGIGVRVEGIDRDIVDKLMRWEDPPSLEHLNMVQTLGLQALLNIMQDIHSHENATLQTIH